MKVCIICGQKFPATRDFFHYNAEMPDRFTKTCVNCLCGRVNDEIDFSVSETISDEQAVFYQKVAYSLATKHLIKN